MHSSGARISRSATLTDQVHAALAEDIATGAFTSGQRIVVERVAARLGVSATPVREAIASWIRDGLIEKSVNGRLRIVPLTQTYVANVFLVRSALEGLAAELAATRISSNELSELSAAMERTTVALEEGDIAAYIDCDALLHRTVASAADNPILLRELETLQAHLAYIRGYSQRHLGDHMRISHSEHQQILAALTAGDTFAGRRAMELHIRQSGERIARLTEFEDGRLLQDRRG